MITGSFGRHCRVSWSFLWVVRVSVWSVYICLSVCLSLCMSVSVCVCVCVMGSLCCTRLIDFEIIKKLLQPLPSAANSRNVHHRSHVLLRSHNGWLTLLTPPSTTCESHFASWRDFKLYDWTKYDAPMLILTQRLLMLRSIEWNVRPCSFTLLLLVIHIIPDSGLKQYETMHI